MACIDEESPAIRTLRKDEGHKHARDLKRLKIGLHVSLAKGNFKVELNE